LNISNNIHGESFIYGVREKSISRGYWKCKREHSKAMFTWSRDTGMQRWTGTRSGTYTNREQGQTLIASEFECRTKVLGISEVMWK